MTEEGLTLGEVKDRFLEAERHLNRTAEAMATLQASSSHLEATRETLSELARSIDGVTSQLAVVAGQMANAAAAIEKTDPAEIQNRLDRLSTSGDQTFARIVAMSEESERRHGDTEDQLGVLRMFLFGMGAFQIVLLVMLILVLVRI